MWLSKRWFCISRITNKKLCVRLADTRRPQGSTLPHLVGGAQEQRSPLWGSTGLSAEQAIGKAEAAARAPPGSRNAVSVRRASPGWGAGPGTGRSLVLHPQRKRGPRCLVQGRCPKGCCLATGNVKRNPDENDSTTQTRSHYLLEQAVLAVVTHFTDEKTRAGKGTHWPQVNGLT